MKNILKLAALIIGIASYNNYGMGGDLSGHGQISDPLWVRSRPFSQLQGEPVVSDHSQRYERLLPLPPLGRQETRVAYYLETEGEAVEVPEVLLPPLPNFSNDQPSGVNFTDNQVPSPSHTRRESKEQDNSELPGIMGLRAPAILNRIYAHLDISAQRQLAQTCRKFGRRSRSALIIPLQDLTENILKRPEKDKEGKIPYSWGVYQNTTSLTIILKYSTLVLTKEHIGLIEKYFPNVVNLTIKGQHGRFDLSLLADNQLAGKIEGLHLVNVAIENFTLENLNKFTQLTDLLIHSKIGNVGFETIAASILAAQLKKLDLSSDGITATNFTKSNLDKFKQLLQLKLCGEFIGDTGFANLTKSILANQLIDLKLVGTCVEAILKEQFDSFQSLRTLKIIGTEIDDAIFAALAKSTLASQLIELELCSSNITTITKEQFNSFKKLKRLDLSFTSLGAIGFKALAESNCAPQLVQLDLFRTGVATISKEQFDSFISLKSLNLGNNPIKNTDFAALAESTLAGQLIELNLESNDITIITEKQTANFKLLKSLNLNFNRIGDAGFSALANSSFADCLEELKLSHSGVTGFRSSKNLNYQQSSNFVPEILQKFKHLKILNLNSNPIGNTGFSDLAYSDLAKHLEILDLIDTKITGENFTPMFLNSFKSMSKLTFRRNTIGKTGEAAIKGSLIVSRIDYR